MHGALDYYTTTNISLSLEDYHNAGLSPERTKEAIEKVVDYTTSFKPTLVCRRSGINHNWGVKIMSIDKLDIGCIVGMIKLELDVEMDKFLAE